MSSLVDYTHILAEWVFTTRIMSEWPECRNIFLDKIFADYPSVVALPMLSCQAVGGTLTESVPVATAWSMLRYAADLLDAVQDGDILPESVSDPSSAIEYASGLIFSAFNAIAIVQEQNIVHRLIVSFSNQAFRASQGQSLSQKYRRDSSVTLENYWQATILKSGSIFRTGLGGGAIAGQAPRDYFESLSNFGNALGVIRQIIDDCRDVFGDPKTNLCEVSLPLLLLSEKLREPIPLFVGRFKNKVSLSNALNKNGVPEVITSVLLEWRRRAMENLVVLEQSSEVQALETILQDFVTKPWLNLTKE